MYDYLMKSKEKYGRGFFINGGGKRSNLKSLRI